MTVPHSKLINSILRISHLTLLDADLIIAGDAALSARNYDHLRELVSERASPTAMFYRAVLLRQTDPESAECLLRELATFKREPAVQGRALIALGAGSVHLDQGLAERLCDAARIVAVDPVVTTHCVRVRAILLSVLGRHHAALVELERGLPLGRSLSGVPGLCLDYLNSISVELTELGHYTEARRLLVPVTRSPLLATHPEWQATAADRRLQQPTAKILHFPFRAMASYENYWTLQQQRFRVSQMALFEKEAWRLHLAELAFTCPTIQSAQAIDASRARVQEEGDYLRSQGSPRT